MTRRIILTAIWPLLFLLPVTVMAAPDSYIGDAAIYSALAGNSSRPKPHILFLIDTSRATLNKASGVKYSLDSDPDTSGIQPYPANGYEPWSIYAANNQGNFNTLVVHNSTQDLENLTCSNNNWVVKTTLLASGTYSGSGSADYPNIAANQAHSGACDTGPTGASYALGNYLNYANAEANATTDTVVQNTYDCSIGVKQGNHYDYTTVAGGCVGIFAPIATHVAASTNEPGVGTDWQSNWTQLSSGCISSATGCSNTSLPPPLSVAGSIPAWAAGTSYSVSSTFAGGTQRQIIYEALAQVVDGARGAVDFGAMTYNPQNQGGNLAYGMGDLSNGTAYDSFLAAIPSDTNSSALIASGPNRPQAESLYDAGHYFGAHYPTSGTIASDAVFPLSTTGMGTSAHISSSMATDYGSTNRNECGYNHIILITNGLSSDDSDPNLTHIVDADGDARPDEDTYGNGGSHYLDDVAAYLHKQEGITVHTILAFQADDELVHHAAIVGGGQFYNVYDANALADALNKLLSSIVLETDTSFVAPVVPASSTNRTISSNRVYLGLFKPQTNRPWLGNLKKYGVSSDLTLLDKSSIAATDANGDFLPDSKSYWGADASDKIVSIDGLLPLAVGGVSGDGGNVGAGGAGGTLKLQLQAGLAASPAKAAWEVTKNLRPSQRFHLNGPDRYRKPVFPFEWIDYGVYA